MTIKENVALPLETHTDLAEDIREIVRYKLGLVGLSGFEDLYPSQLSGGMKKGQGWQEHYRWILKFYFLMNPLQGWTQLLPGNWMT